MPIEEYNRLFLQVAYGANLVLPVVYFLLKDVEERRNFQRANQFRGSKEFRTSMNQLLAHRKELKRGTAAFYKIKRMPKEQKAAAMELYYADDRRELLGPDGIVLPDKNLIEIQERLVSVNEYVKKANKIMKKDSIRALDCLIMASSDLEIANSKLKASPTAQRCLNPARAAILQARRMRAELLKKRR